MSGEKERESAPPVLWEPPIVAECEAGHPGMVWGVPIVVTQFDIRAVRNLADQEGRPSVDAFAAAQDGRCRQPGCGLAWRRRDPFGFRDQIHIRGRGWV